MSAEKYKIIDTSVTVTYTGARTLLSTIDSIVSGTTPSDFRLLGAIGAKYDLIIVPEQSPRLEVYSPAEQPCFGGNLGVSVRAYQR